jgi:uncharacterized membrane protein
MEEAAMQKVERDIEVDAPLSAVYNQWTQFETFPAFMDGVESVTQLDDATLHWVAEVGGERKEWDARITEQRPDEVIAWEGFGDANNRGRVFFGPGEQAQTRVSLAIEYETDGVVERIGDALGVVSKQVQEDLERFKHLMETRGFETGAWRGEIHQRPTGTEM